MEYQWNDGSHNNKEVNYVEQAMKVRAFVDESTKRNNLKKMERKNKLEL